MQTKYVAAAVSLGVGLVSLGVATYLFLSAPHSPAHGTSAAAKDAAAKPKFHFDMAPAPRGGVASFGATF